MTASWRWPGAHHPFGVLGWAEAAARLGVDDARMAAWRTRGLGGHDGGIDGFALIRWVERHAVAEVPALARRWRVFLDHFRPAVTGTEVPQRWRVQRQHALLGEHAAPVQWTLPALAEGGGQHVDSDVVEGLVRRGPHHVGAAGAVVHGRAVVERMPVRAPQPELVPVVEDLVAAFTYGYRQHVPGEALGERHAGTCLDAAFALGSRMTDLGRAWRPVSGVVARTSVANPHFWIEVEGPGGAWLPVDPALAILARQFSADPQEWRLWVRRFTGGCPVGVVMVCRGEHPVAVPGGATLGSIAGEVVVAGENAWPCLDWVCGQCSWSFRRA